MKMTNKLTELLTEKEPAAKSETVKGKDNKFDPKFNVREEFAIWVRKEFPELKDHSAKNTVYEMLEARKSEVYLAAQAAMLQGLGSTDACARARLEEGWKKINQYFSDRSTSADNKKQRASGLNSFVEALEDLSISLGGNRHYTECGTFAYGNRETYRAFVYRFGEKESENALYIVSSERETKMTHAADAPTLIGEFEDATDVELMTLLKGAFTFRGPEKKFIKHIDSEIKKNDTRYGRWGRY